ncbi:hypothetical protein DVH05_028576 [Phytophthora capsici]|nr:hypothetical protein DVH05_028576 [Phytophthora capsici]
MGGNAPGFSAIRPVEPAQPRQDRNESLLLMSRVIDAILDSRTFNGGLRRNNDELEHPQNSTRLCGLVTVFFRHLAYHLFTLQEDFE